MARRLSKKDNKFLARLVSNDRAPCAFCQRDVDDELTYGKLYAIGNIQCHYYCCLLSCCLIQKGNDEEGLFGFLYSDIVAEVERCKKHKCSYCGRAGANLGCSVSACRKQFHLPCGREKHAVSLYYGSYKSFCQHHAPRQKIPSHIVAKLRLQLKAERKARSNDGAVKVQDSEGREALVCVICYEAVLARAESLADTFWPPCCARDACFHRTCLQRMALSAGKHYLKCPLCNDKERFYDAVLDHGYYVPDRDAAWELEQNAFAEIYERPNTCCLDHCLCPLGREHDEQTGKWDIKLCLLCGSAGAHEHCIDQSEHSKYQLKPIDQSDRRSSNQSSIQPYHQESTAQTNIPNLNETSTTVETKSTSTNQSDDENSIISIASSQVSIASSQVTNTSSQVTNTSSQVTNTSSQVTNTSSQVTNTSSLVTNMSSQVLNTSSQVLNVSSQVLNTSVQVSNGVLSSEPNAVCLQASEASMSPEKSVRFVCKSCLPAAPEDLSQLVSCIESMIQQEQAATAVRGPLMPSRMSIRRSKGRIPLRDRPSTSRSNRAANTSSDSQNTISSREELNLKPPRRKEDRTSELSRTEENVIMLRREDNILLSPVKLLELKFREKMACSGVRDVVFDKKLIEELRNKFRKPTPLCEKKRIVNIMLEDLTRDMKLAQTSSLKEWGSLSKLSNTVQDYNMVGSAVDSSKRQETFDKEISSPTTTPTKGPRNHKTDTTQFGIKEADLKPPLEDLNETPEEPDDLKIDLDTVENSNIIKNRPLMARRCKKESPEVPKNWKKRVQNKVKSKIVSRRLNNEKNDSKVVPDDKKKDPKDTSNKSNNKTNDSEVASNILNDITKDPNDMSNDKINVPKDTLNISNNETNDSKVTPNIKDQNVTYSEPLEDLKPRLKSLDVSESLKDKTTTITDVSKRKTIDIRQDSSLEISGNEQSLNIDVIKIEDSPTAADSYRNLHGKVETVRPKLNSSEDKSRNDFIDMENFKKQYLSEVGREFVCSFKHKHETNFADNRQFKSPIDFAKEAAVKKDVTHLDILKESDKTAKKRKLSEGNVLTSNESFVKKRKTSESDLEIFYRDDIEQTSNETKDNETSKAHKDKRRSRKTRDKRKMKKGKKRSLDNKKIKVTIDSSEKRSAKKRIKTRVAIRNENISVKIKWKKERLSLNIESKNKAKKERKLKTKECHSKFKQYVLQFPEGSTKEILVKPEKEVCPLKRKYVRQEKSTDNMKQTSIQSFFKVKSE